MDFTLKGELPHYGDMRATFIGIEYDERSEQTIVTRKIIGKTIVSGECWEYNGNVADSWAQRYLNDKFEHCPLGDYNEFQIGQRVND